ARQLAEGSAFLIEQGCGVCNLLYLDNLIYSILGVIKHATPAAGFYNIADDELTPWRDYYTALATQLGGDHSEIHQLPINCFRPRVENVWERFKQTAFFQLLKRKLSKPVQDQIKRLTGVGTPEPPVYGPVPKSEPIVTRKEWHLQNTRHKLPTQKFA